MKHNRKSITKKIKFEILKRDSFTCQYCGKEAPNVVLEVDHINPICKGGGNDLFNLITSCYDCNRGKSGRTIKNQDALKKQKQELNEISKRREQLILLKKWKEELHKYDDEECNIFEEFIMEFCDEYTLNTSGKCLLKKLIKKYTKEELIEGIQASFDSYFVGKYLDEQGMSKAFELAFNKIGAVIEGKKKIKDKPYLKDIYYCGGILKNRLNYFDKRKVTAMLLRHYEKYKNIDALQSICLNCKHWTEFRQMIESNIKS